MNLVSETNQILFPELVPDCHIHTDSLMFYYRKISLCVMNGVVKTTVQTNVTASTTVEGTLKNAAWKP